MNTHLRGNKRTWQKTRANLLFAYNNTLPDEFYGFIRLHYNVYRQSMEAIRRGAVVSGAECELPVFTSSAGLGSPLPGHMYGSVNPWNRTVRLDRRPLNFVLKADARRTENVRPTVFTRNRCLRSVWPFPRSFSFDGAPYDHNWRFRPRVLWPPLPGSSSRKRPIVKGRFRVNATRRKPTATTTTMYIFYAIEKNPTTNIRSVEWLCSRRLCTSPS